MIVTTPAALVAAIKSAAAGAIITLSPGAWQDISLSKVAAPNITIDATAAKIPSLKFTSVSGITVKGGTYGPGDPTRPRAIVVDFSNHVTINGATCIDVSRVCLVLSRSQFVQALNTTVLYPAGDGIDIAGSTDVVIDNTHCTVGPYTGNPLTDQHRDCVQVWTIFKTAATPTYTAQRITITKTYASGGTQGVDAYFHDITQAGDHITIDGTTGNITQPSCATLLNASYSRMTNNHCTTAAGAKYTVKVSVIGGTNNVAFGNVNGVRP